MITARDTPQRVVGSSLAALLIFALGACGGGGGLPPVIGAGIARMVVVLPGQELQEGGRILGAPDDHTAGESFDVEVYLLSEDDELLTDFTGTIGLLPGAATDPAPALVVPAGGIASFNVLAVTAGASLILTPVDITVGDLTGFPSSTYEVSPGAASRVALLLPGETLRPGLLGPGTGTPASVQQVGVTFSVSVVSTDLYGNPVAAAGTATVTTGDIKDIDPAPAALVGGTAGFDVTLVTAGAGLFISVTHTGLTGATSRPLTALSGPADRLFALLPTQAVSINQAGPAIVGPPPTQTTGQPFVVRLLAADSFGNTDTTYNGNVTLATSDPGDDAPEGDPYTVALTAGEATPVIQLATATVSPTKTTLTVDDGVGGLEAGISSGFDVAAGGATRLLVVLPGQALSPGFPDPQITGTPATQAVGTPFAVSVYATDAFGNVDPSYDGAPVTVTTPGDEVDADPGVVLLSGGQATSIMIDHRTALAVTSVLAESASLGDGASDLYDVAAAPVSRMVILLPGETLSTGLGGPIVSGTPEEQRADVSFTFEVALTDAYGNRASGPDRTLTVVSPSAIDNADAVDPQSAATGSGLAMVTRAPVTARSDYHYVVSDDLSILPDAQSSDFVVSTVADRLVAILPGRTLVIQGDADGFALTGAAAAQQTGVAFPVEVRAVDRVGNADVNTTAAAQLVSTTDALAAISPGSQVLSGGSAVFMVTNKTQGTSHRVQASNSLSLLLPFTTGTYTADATADRLLALPPGQSVSVGASAPVIGGTPAQQRAGVPFNVTVRAVDAFGNTDADATPTVVVATPVDVHDTEPAPAALVAGTGMFSIGAVQANASYTVSATDQAAILASHTSSPINLIYGSADRLVVTLPDQSLSVSASGPIVAPMPAADLDAGQTVLVGVTATDPFGNRAFDLTTVVTLRSNDPAAGESSGPLQQGMSGGFNTYPFTPFTAVSGGLALTADDTGAGTLPDGVQSGLSVLSAAADELLLVYPGESVVPTALGPRLVGMQTAQSPGAMFSFTVLATDVYGNIDTAAAPTVQIDTSDPGDTEPPDAPLAAGMGSFDLTSTVTGPVVVLASDTAGADPLATSTRSYRSYPIYLGQLDGMSGGAGTSASTLGAPDDARLVALAEGGTRAYVADAGNSRVLGYADATLLDTGVSADLVLGQVNFTGGLCNGVGLGAASLCTPTSVAIDEAGNLWVADSANNRVLRFNDPFAGDAIADLVLGQGGFTGAGCNQGFASPTGATLCAPSGVVLDANGDVWVADSANNRVLRYSAPFSSGMTANLVLGQGGFTTSAAATTATGLSAPARIAFDGADVWVSDGGNHRVVRYPAPFSSGMAADVALGQGDLTTGTSGLADNRLSGPVGLAFDGGGDLWIIDSGNNRMLLFPAPFATDMSAVAVLGQPDFTSNAPNEGGLSGDTLSTPRGLHWSEGALVISDAGNNRVVLKVP